MLTSVTPANRWAIKPVRKSARYRLDRGNA